MNHPHPMARLCYLQNQESAIVSVLAFPHFTDRPQPEREIMKQDLARIRAEISEMMK